jgi:hypothetical protein
VATSASSHITLADAAEDDENMSFSKRRPKNTLASARTFLEITA